MHMHKSNDAGEKVRGIIPLNIARQMTRQQLLAARMSGMVPLLAGGDVTSVSQPDPLGTQISGFDITVDTFVNPPTRIPGLIRNLVANNQGYWIEEIYRSGGFTVNGGAIIYTETFPEDHFLPAGQSIAPRSPGSEAPRVAPAGRPPKMAYPESYSMSLEITDEARQRNQVMQVQDVFTRAANTFADRLQTRGEQALDAFVTSSGRTTTAGAGTFGQWSAAAPLENYTSTAPRPSAEFARIQRLFLQDMAGVQPDTVIVAPADAEEFTRIYGPNAAAVLAQFGLRMVISVRRTAGTRLYLRAGQVGVMAFEKPLGAPEYVREGIRFTDVYVMETRPVFVVNGAEYLMQVVGA